MGENLKEEDVDVNVIRFPQVLNDVLCAVVHFRGDDDHFDLLVDLLLVQVGAEFRSVSRVQGALGKVVFLGIVQIKLRDIFRLFLCHVRGVFDDLRGDLPGRQVFFQLYNDEVSVPIHAQQVKVLPVRGSHLPADGQPVGVQKLNILVQGVLQFCFPEQFSRGEHPIFSQRP